ncbi:MAG: hypothetical protein ACLT53_17795, partial [Clostridium cadaveris]
MSDSVGKISLDLEVQSDLGNQIGNVSNQIGKDIEATFKNSTKGIFDVLQNSIDASMKAINDTVKASLDEMKATVKSTIDSILAITKNVKVPKPNIPENQASPNGTVVVPTSVPRAPPMPRVYPIKPSIDNANVDELKAEIDNTAAVLDNINAKIEQQKLKLNQLKEAYNNCFNQNQRNTLEDQILKTEANINKLIGQSDKLGFKLSDLDNKMANLGNSSNKASGGASKLKSTLSNIYGVFNKSGKGAKILGDSTKTANKGIGRMNTGIGFTLKQMFKWMIILPMIAKGINSMALGMLNNLKTNEQFSNSLAQIKS